MKYWMLGALIGSALASALAHPATDSLDWKAASKQLNQLMHIVRTDTNAQARQNSSKQLQEKLQAFLQEEDAYTHSFEDLEGISVLQPESKTFRIFTWQLYVDKDHYYYRGLIQTKDGNIYPLEDQSDDMRTVEFSTYKPNNWYGALYYKLHPFQHEGQEHYLLFGYDAYSFYQRRKVLDVLYFNDQGEPRFGKAVLELKDGRGQIRSVNRMLLEYSSSVNVTLNYSEADGLVKYDHLIYGSPIPSGGPSSVPDGSYCGLKYQAREGTWKYVDKIHEDDPNNILIDATSYERMVQQGTQDKDNKKRKKDLFGRLK